MKLNRDQEDILETLIILLKEDEQHNDDNEHQYALEIIDNILEIGII